MFLGEDEKTCTDIEKADKRTCSDDEYQCKDGRCILVYKSFSIAFVFKFQIIGKVLTINKCTFIRKLGFATEFRIVKMLMMN